ncbi:MAG: hypothetical protein HLUCCA11_11640 [Phormidesmis priestleyi Ana]|uniref:Uncharacterized protein n=1 Tax=Phormidesmis priestleyi Ana TaxID=1666911 RepID=A0A0P7ZPZ2_9CYAN|nr:MAG: hypothetical protein HLUCCA11_11640 [Phormidesmis priestleyi Ana]
MISAAGKHSNLWRLWAALVAILLMTWVTLWLTQSAVRPMSTTSLSGLTALKPTATEAMPYEVFSELV